MFKKIRAKNDARLFFKYKEINLDLSKIKTELIKLGYIEHVEGDRFIELKKLPAVKELIKILENKQGGRDD